MVLKHILLIPLVLLTACTFKTQEKSEFKDTEVKPLKKYIVLQLEIYQDGRNIRTMRESCVENRSLCSLEQITNSLEQHRFPQDYKCSLTGQLSQLNKRKQYLNLPSEFTCKSFAYRSDKPPYG